MRALSGRGDDQRQQRAQSAPLGLLLVLSLVIVGSTVVVVLGATALTDAESGLDRSRSEKVMTQLDSQASLVALGSASNQQIALSGTERTRYSVEPDAGRMNISIVNTSVSPATTTTLLNVSLGAIVYENGEDRVVYQGGGVWMRSGGGTLMVSPPEFYYRDATLTLPLITVRGDRSLGDRATVSANGTTRLYPNATADRMNPLENGIVNVSVTSEYYQSWGRFFEQRTDGNAYYDHENDTVTTTLVVPTGPREVDSAIAATSAGGEIRLSGSGSDPARTNSYNSSQGDYASTLGSSGTITTAGDIIVTGNSEIDGSLTSGDRVEVKGSGIVTGDVNYTTSKKIKGTVYGNVDQISGVEGANAIDGYVSGTVDNLSSTNDNAAESSAFTAGNRLEDGDHTLSSGDYYFTDLTVDDDDTLTLDTSGGNLTIGVRDYVRIQEGADIEVIGDDTVRLFVLGEDVHPTANAHFSIPNSAGSVDIADDENSTQFWMYGQSDFTARLSGSGSPRPRFEGVIYAPAGQTGSSEIYVGKSEVFGGVVAGSVEMDNGALVHYDLALKQSRAVPANTNIIRLTYLHVSENRINVTSK
ncbi:polymer-forming cytoskeletal protein [Haloarcula marina]|uniref:polymer-forming cytoskeletal protein n=1 Tax=Haloarcula marina TaxID=2961574 RepID=UPI0020B7B1D4|nr:polymer-forming cytoskeletal protein [Halomicroarcula marina]